jgi:transposase
MFIEIQQLKELGFNRTQVARRLQLNWKTADKYWTMEPDGFADAINQAGKRTRKLDKYEDFIVEWLCKNPDMTAAQVEDWLKERHNAYEIKERTVRSYVTHLRDKHGIPKQSSDPRQYEAVPDPPMGHQLQLDFGETKIQTESGGWKKLHAFGSVLANSRYKYGEWSETPLTTNLFIAILMNCFSFYGGVPKEIVIDQDKLMVVSENYGEIIYTHQFEQFRKKMGFKLWVCRPSDPESKGRVEAVVKYMKYGYAANRTFTDISAWNQSCLDWLDRTANQKVHGTTKKIPAEVFALEKQYLKPVPSVWSLPTDSVTRLVRKDNTIMYKSNRYSVPTGTYAPGKETQIKIVADKLVLMDIRGEEIIAEHQLSCGKGELIQNRNHLRNHDGSINELYQKVFQALDYVPHLPHFLDVIRKEKGKYVRDQYNLIFKVQKAHSQEILLQAFDFCHKNGLYSAVSLREAAEHFANVSEVAVTSEFSYTGVLPDYLRIQANTRDISEYVGLQDGGAAK